MGWSIIALTALCDPCQASDSLQLKVAGFFTRTGRESGNRNLDWKSLPRAINLRRELEQLNVNFIQQGSRNSCAAFSAVSVLEFQLRRLGCDVDLSEQYVLWAAKDVGANPTAGLSIKHLCEGLQKHGVCREELMPYRRADEIAEPSPRAREDASKMPEIRLNSIVPFDGIFGFRDDQIFTVCKALSRHEPVCFSSRWSDSETPLERGTVMDVGPMSGNHMVILVGYERNPDDPSDGHFLIRNSWGLGWGDFGYAKLPFSYVRKHAIDALQFRFVWKEDLVETRSESAEAVGDSPGPVQFAALWMSLSAIAAFIGFYVPFRLFARKNKSAGGVLRYLLRIAPLFAASTLAAGSAALAIANGRPALIFALGCCMILVAFLYFRITMRHFGVGFWRVICLLLIAGLIRNGLDFVESRFIPFDWYRSWQRVFATTPIGEKPLLFLLGTEDRARLLAMQTVEWAPGGWDAKQEKDWLDQWADELKRDRSRMQSALPLAKPFYARRVAAYEAERRAFERRFRKGDGIVLSGASQPPGEGENWELWEMYEALRQERANLDWNDPFAVKQFNERAEQYRIRKESVEGKRSAPAA